VTPLRCGLAASKGSTTQFIDSSPGCSGFPIVLQRKLSDFSFLNLPMATPLFPAQARAQAERCLRCKGRYGFVPASERRLGYYIGIANQQP
jgi:hypothetical protein